MIDNNLRLFAEFELTHAQYHLDPKKHQEKFNQLGELVLNAIREYENRLCSRSETGGYATYSTALAEKFQKEIKTLFPLIDQVGITVKKSKSNPENKSAQKFILKKIKFS